MVFRQNPPRDPAFSGAEGREVEGRCGVRWRMRIRQSGDGRSGTRGNGRGRAPMPLIVAGVGRGRRRRKHFRVPTDVRRAPFPLLAPSVAQGGSLALEEVEQLFFGVDAELLVEVHAVRLDGAAGEEELLLDVGGVAPLRDERHDFQFAGREPGAFSDGAARVFERGFVLGGDDVGKQPRIALGERERVAEREGHDGRHHERGAHGVRRPRLSEGGQGCQATFRRWRQATTTLL